MPNPYSHIDLGYLESITDGSQELIKELIVIFIEQIPEFKDGLEEGLSRKDWTMIASVAHKAKSSVISMGMQDLGNNDLKNLELIAKSLRVEELIDKNDNSEELQQLQRTIDGYPEERKAWLNNNKSANSVRDIIQRFNQTCDDALHELQDVIDNY